MTIVSVKKLTGKVQLFCHYPGQTNQQACYVELDCEEGDLVAAYNAEIDGGAPFDVIKELRLRWAIPCLTADAANELLDAIEPYAQEVVEGFELGGLEKDVGRFTKEAFEARDAITALCEDTGHLQHVEAWPARGYFLDTATEEVWASRWGLTAESTDTDLAAMDARIRSEESDCVHILLGLGEFLTELRTAMRKRRLGEFMTELRTTVHEGGSNE